ncbi:hypothetical protein ABIS04_10890 [Shewanella sp. H8]|uniref:hypothetical protein n=1 Tax=Shewanella sp. H8 TaxID=3342676 RepID=UPI00331532DA
MKNIDKFNEITAQMFSALYEKFPEKVKFDSREILNFQGEFGEYVDGIWNENPELPSEEVEFVQAVADWLMDEGYIKGVFQSYSPTGTSVTLTSKGLAVMNSVPDSISESSTLGQELSSLVKEKSKEEAGKLIGHTISGMWSMVLNSLN